MTALAFDAAAHRYTFDGRELIGVTQALTDAGLIDARWHTDEAALRGTYVHAAIALLHEDDLDVDRLDASLLPYVNAYLRFVTESGFERQAWEERVCDALLGYAGTLDLRGRFVEQAHGIDLIDIKTGTVPGWAGYQTAGYARCLPDRPIRRWALNLRADGKYSLQRLEARTDERVFLAALTIAQVKRGLL
jgi:hypothetical protein